jgi:hypothetical protein
MVSEDLSFLFYPPQDSDVFTRTLYYPRSPSSGTVENSAEPPRSAPTVSDPPTVSAPTVTTPTVTSRTALGDNRHAATLSKFRAGVFSNHSAAVETVTPFLNEHVPDQVHIPDGRGHHHSDGDRDKVYCYRHQPDLRCQRRSPQEDTMAEIQKVLPSRRG